MPPCAVQDPDTPRRERHLRVPTPSDRLDWSPDPSAVLRSRFGAIVHRIVAGPGGERRYDVPVWVEPPGGAIIVATTPADDVVLVEQLRPVPIAPGATKHGLLSVELPRGFSEDGEDPLDTARRELEEETGCSAGAASVIGHVCANTLFFARPVPVVHVRVQRLELSGEGDVDEAIRRVLVASCDAFNARIARGDVICGLSLAAWALYRSR